ncbi:MAG TPA: hypothetical protein ENG36_03625 [Lentisphaerae bacterium]|nr:hypothetical protein [Lentisphaerota bacterium]
MDRCGNTNLVVLSTESLLFSQRRQQLCALWADWYGLVASDEACLIGSEVEEDANAADQLPPALELVAPPCPTVEVTTAEYYLHGYTSDGGGIRSVRINGEKVFFSKAEETVRVDFARRLPLALGTNLFEIRVDDLAGNVRKKTICVIRRKPLYLCTEYRTSIAIPPLYSSSSDPQTYPLTLIVQSWLQGALAREPVRFNLLEREEGWEYVLQEQRLSLSDLVDPRSALQIGRIVPAEILIMGSLFREGKGVTVLAKGVETSHGRILFTDDVYAEGERAELKYQVSGLALKIKQRFPLLMANIISIKGRRAVLDVGTNRGIGLWSSFIVISNSDGAATSPEVVKIAGDPVRLRVVRVRGNSCDTTIAPPQAARSISVECKAFTR